MQFYAVLNVYQAQYSPEAEHQTISFKTKVFENEIKDKNAF